MNLRYIIAFSLLLGTIGLQAQVTTYHRIYSNNETMDTTLHHLASDRVGDGIGSILSRHIEGDDKSLVYISTDKKGKLMSQVEMDFGMDSVVHRSQADMTRNHDSILYSNVIEANGDPFLMIGSISTDGSTHTARRYTGVNFEDAVGVGPTDCNLDGYIDSSYLHGIGDKNPIITRFNIQNEPFWSQRYILTDTFGNEQQSIALSLDAAEDSTIYSGGLLTDNSMYQLVLDSLGNALMSKSYRHAGSPQSSYNKVISITEGRAAHAGYRGDASYVFLTDSLGDVIWAKSLRIKEVATEIYAITHALSGDIIVGGKYFLNADTTQLFTAAFDLDGEVKWVSEYGPRRVDTDLKLVSLHNLVSAGVFMVANGFNEEDEDGIEYIKQDENGTTPCSDTTEMFLSFDITISIDTLLSTSEAGIAEVDTLAHEFDGYGGIIEPTLIIEAEQINFCPNEIISELLTAVVTNVDTSNVAYAWQDGTIMTDTLRATEKGDYTVTVTVTENFCYSMCDTIKLTRSVLPTVDINESFFCENGEVFARLNADVSSGTGPYTYIWADGTESPQLVTNTNGSYSIKVFDSCGDSAEASIDLAIPQTTLSGDIAFVCSNEQIILTLNSAVTPENLQTGLQYMWSNGGTEQSTIVTEIDTYTVTVTDDCGEQLIVPIDLSDRIMFTLSLDSDLDCDNSQTIITADPESDGSNSYTYNWSTDESTSSIAVAEAGIYSVTVTDECGVALIESIEITNLVEIKWAKVFFPNILEGAEDELDGSFGPVLSCGEDFSSITDYEFKVFNRWGQEVFSTTDPSDRWDGTFNGEKVPTEVYIWYATYNGNDTPDKGDVTVLY